jgi:hypothetical protein
MAHTYLIGRIADNLKFFEDTAQPGQTGWSQAVIPIYRGTEKDKLITKARKADEIIFVLSIFRVFVMKKVFQKMQRI